MTFKIVKLIRNKVLDRNAAIVVLTELLAIIIFGDVINNLWKINLVIGAMVVLVDSRKVVDMQREKQAERLKQAEKHLSDMEHSRELIEKDLREAYENYKLGMTDKETYLEQRKTYEHVLACMQENIEKQKTAVSKMADVDVPEVGGLEMLEGQLKLTELNREMVDAFVEEIVVYAKDRVEIKWKFKDEFGEVGRV